MALDVTYIGCDRPEDREFVDRHLLPYVMGVLEDKASHVRVALVRLTRDASAGDGLDRLVREVANQLRPGVSVLRKRTDDDKDADGYALLLVFDHAEAGWTYLPREVLLQPRRATATIRRLYTAILGARLEVLVAGFDYGSTADGEQ